MFGLIPWGAVFGALNSLLTFILFRWWRLWKEDRKLRRQEASEHVEIIFCIVVEQRLHVLRMGGFRTIDLGERLFQLILKWNWKPSADLILPEYPEYRRHLHEMLEMFVPPHLQQQLVLMGAWLRRAGVPSRDVVGLPHADLTLALVRPDVVPGWRDCARVIVLPTAQLAQWGALRPNVPPDDHDAESTFVRSLDVVVAHAAEQTAGGVLGSAALLVV
jgi:hypothetical protein